MNLPFFIAGRYLFSRKKQHIINIISGIAAVGVCIGTFALVVVLSVFNGFDGLIKSYFSILDPDLKITAREGKLFDPSHITDSILSKTSGIASYACIIEENALLAYNERQYIATLKGVPDNFRLITGIDSLIVDGVYKLESEGIAFAVPGLGVASQLGINLNNADPIYVYVPKKGLKASLNPQNALNIGTAFPSGIFSLLEEVDSKTMFVPYSFAANLTQAGNKTSSVEIELVPGTRENKIRKIIERQIGKNYHVKNKYQQHDSLYKTMKSEKWATYLILAFILVIASFNILGSLSMLIIDKKEDIMVLRSMGASGKLIRNIFLVEGWLISLIGTIAGMVLGLLVCWLQIHFNIIALPGEGSFVISAYPVDIQSADLFLIGAVVLTIGWMAAWYPVMLISKEKIEINPSLKE